MFRHFEVRLLKFTPIAVATGVALACGSLTLCDSTAFAEEAGSTVPVVYMTHANQLVRLGECPASSPQFDRHCEGFKPVGNPIGIRWYKEEVDRELIARRPEGATREPKNPDRIALLRSIIRRLETKLGSDEVLLNRRMLEIWLGYRRHHLQLELDLLIATPAESQWKKDLLDKLTAGQDVGLPVTDGTRDIALAPFVKGDFSPTGARIVRVPFRSHTDEKPFEMAATQVTQFQWFFITGSNPSSHRELKHCPEDHIVIDGVGMCPEFPVNLVTGQDVDNYIKKLNQMDVRYQYDIPDQDQFEDAAVGTLGYYQGNLGLGWTNGPGYRVGTRYPSNVGIFDTAGSMSDFTDSFLTVSRYNTEGGYVPNTSEPAPAFSPSEYSRPPKPRPPYYLDKASELYGVRLVRIKSNTTLN